ncbi:MAG: RagB/SusD family nutrient uptake outer membrane protein, partial [Bacteroidia bacterium]
MRFLKPIMLLTTLSIAGAACNKMLDLKPENLTLAEEALNTPADVQALLNSCYDEFANLMNGSVQNYHELMGEHLSEPPSLAGSLYFSVYKRGTFSFRTADREYLDFYNCILRVNTIFGRMGSVPGIDAATADRLKGEGYFLRAWCHWELVKLWAQPYGFTADNSHPGVPIRLNADKSIELRSTVKQVYDRILLDLDSSITLIPESNGNYAVRHAATALKAKVLFFMNRFSDALAAANTVLNSGRYSFSDSLNRFTSEVPQETIFKLVSTGPSDNRGSALINNYRSDNNPNPNLK